MMNFHGLNNDTKDTGNKLLFAIGLFLFTACQPKADYKLVLTPLNNFTLSLNDSLRGAESMEDLSCYLFLALKGDITFEDLKKFIPDSSDISHLYKATETTFTGKQVNENADSVNSKMQRAFYETKSKAAIFHTSWGDAIFEKVMIFEIENQKIPSTRIIMETKTGKDYLRCSAMCMQLNGRWFLGEGLKYGT